MSNLNIKPKVLVSHQWPPEILLRLKEHCQVKVLGSDSFTTQEEFLKALPGADAVIIIPSITIDNKVLDIAGPQLKVIATASAGLGHIDLNECRRRGIKVGYVADTVTKAVAEMTISLMLATARRLDEAMQSVKTGAWGTKWDSALWMCGKQVSGSVIGIVGLGRIGLATAKRLSAFEPSRILYSGNSVKPEAAKVRAEFVSFSELLETSDFVIATCSVHARNQKLFNAEAFARMKKDSVFINVTRGALVDQDALYDALSTHKIGAAGLDVTTPEPLPTDHKLLTLKNCLITPHIASGTIETRMAMCSLTVDNILAGLTDNPLPCPC
ncbi:glyoxylate reductase/hydroxypyruvate reductase [Biomphalaria glabrata]|nr:glyoxylate reductase/hydroxypyruvate reductase-like [Biomphalaria glabrata]